MKFTKRNGGFTMLEILAVLAIVLILAAILFPAIESAREKSLATACNQNVKGLVLAITQYEQDKNQFPAGRQFIGVGAAGTSASDMYKWSNLIAPYMHADPAASSAMGTAATSAASTTLFGLPAGEQDRLYPEAYRCPSVSNWDKVGVNGSYGYNYQYLGNADPRSIVTATVANRGTVNFPVRKSSIVRPDKMICVADSDGTGFNSYISASGAPIAGPNERNLGSFAYLLDPTFLPVRQLGTATVAAEPVLPGIANASIGPAAGGLWVDNAGLIVLKPNAANQIYRSVVSNRHKGSANVGFLDGHVESLLREACYFQQVPNPTTTQTLFMSNALWNGFGLDNDLNGNGAVNPATIGERMVDENEIFISVNAAAGTGIVLPTANLANNYNPAGTLANYGFLNGCTGYGTWGPGFDVLAAWFAIPNANFRGPTLPHLAPFKLEAGALQ